MLEDVKKDLAQLLDIWSKKFNFNPLINTDYRDRIDYNEQKKLGETICWYTVENFNTDTNEVYYDKKLNKYLYNGFFRVTIECESKENNNNLEEFLLFLVNMRSTNLYFRYDMKNKFRRKVRGAKILDNKNFYIRNEMYFKKVITFNVHYEFESKGDFYIWQ